MHIFHRVIEGPPKAIYSNLTLKARLFRSGCSRMCPVETREGMKYHSLSGKGLSIHGHPCSVNILS